MRLLFLTAYFPPCDFGWGYMRICQAVAERLHARGHVLAVLTSRYRHGPEQSPFPVHRRLHLEPDWAQRLPAGLRFFVGRRRREAQDRAALQALIRQFRPDAIVVWHAHGLARRMLQDAEAQAGWITAWYFANYFPELPDEHWAYWSQPAARWPVRALKAPLARLARRQLAAEGKPLRLRYQHSICVSHFVRQRLVAQGLIPAEAVVVPNGVDVAHFFQPPRPLDTLPLRALVAGRVAAEKGIHTLLCALGKVDAATRAALAVTVLGNGPAAYRAELDVLVARHGLGGTVRFAPPVPSAQMARVWAEYDLLLLPSEWDEPLSCSMLEAMAAGLLVIGTTTGGSGEALHPGHTGLTFAPGDADALAAQLAALVAAPERCAPLAAAGQRLVRAEYAIAHTSERIEEQLAAWRAAPTERRA